MELEQERREQEEEIRVLKAKAKKHRDEEKTGLPRLNNYCRIIGLCGFCNKVAEYRCERCGMCVARGNVTKKTGKHTRRGVEVRKRH